MTGHETSSFGCVDRVCELSGMWVSVVYCSGQ